MYNKNITKRCSTFGANYTPKEILSDVVEILGKNVTDVCGDPYYYPGLFTNVFDIDKDGYAQNWNDLDSIWCQPPGISYTSEIKNDHGRLQFLEELAEYNHRRKTGEIAGKRPDTPDGIKRITAMNWAYKFSKWMVDNPGKPGAYMIYNVASIGSIPQFMLIHCYMVVTHKRAKSSLVNSSGRLSFLTTEDGKTWNAQQGNFFSSAILFTKNVRRESVFSFSKKYGVVS